MIGAPIVAAHIPPPDSANVPNDADITIVFDRPIVPLTQVQGASAEKRFSGWPVTITPSIKGRWRWLGTTTATFEPEKSLALATKYTVSVPAGIQTVSGDTTEKDFSWSFETVRPIVRSTEPFEASASAGPGSKIQIMFNQEMDLMSVKDKLLLTQKA